MLDKHSVIQPPTRVGFPTPDKPDQHECRAAQRGKYQRSQAGGLLMDFFFDAQDAAETDSDTEPKSNFTELQMTSHHDDVS